MKRPVRDDKAYSSRPRAAISEGMFRRVHQTLAVLLIAAFAVAGGLGAGSARAQISGAATFKKGQLTIVSGENTHRFTVELALSNRQQMQGLMFRRHLAPDAGMLFVYRREQTISMWMKNTYVPLDMLFIDREGRIVGIAERTLPLSERVISSGAPALAVLEVNAGTAARLGIRKGDIVRSPALAKKR